jgi:hypothetical protein
MAEKYRNLPQTGSLFKSKFKTNDGSEEDETREDYYGTYVDINDKEWKLKGYINKSEYGTWLKIKTFDPNAKLKQSEPVIQQEEPEDDIPF